QLNAGTGLIEAIGLIKYNGAQPVLREAQRAGEPANSGAGDDDGAGRRHHGASGGVLDQSAFGRLRRMRVQGDVVFVEGRAIGADDLVIFTHVEKDMRVIKRWLRPRAHELARADLDLDEASLIVEVRNNVLGHDCPCSAWRRSFEPASPAVERRRTIAANRFNS